jgi:phosphoribosylamine--glycine ligase
MITKKGPKVLEFNCRFGDPETQAILPLMKSDVLTLFESVLQGNLDTKKIDWKKGSSICVVVAAGGYPEKVEVGEEIKGLHSNAFANGSYVFHAGTSSKLLTSAGRVLGVFATGDTLKEAIAHSYKEVEAIRFTNMQYRGDIGKKGLKKL